MTVDEDTSKRSYLFSTTIVSTFESTRDFLVIGCATCENGKGWLKFYNPATIKLLKGIPGTSAYQNVGDQISLVKNADNTD